MRRLVYLGLALGLVSGAATVVSLTACYDVPKPDCGFRCGPAGECPEDYTCATFEDRCHRIGTEESLRCESGGDDTVDAAIDMPIDAVADAASDAAIDAAADANVDAAGDAATD